MGARSSYWNWRDFLYWVGWPCGVRSWRLLPDNKQLELRGVVGRRIVSLQEVVSLKNSNRWNGDGYLLKLRDRRLRLAMSPKAGKSLKRSGLV
jgi:hypothetical protein